MNIFDYSVFYFRSSAPEAMNIYVFVFVWML